MEDKMIQNLEQQTGKKLEELVQMTRESGNEKHGQMVKWLKETLGIGHGYANLVALKARDADVASVSKEKDPVEEQYKGKEQLKPIYQKLYEAITNLGHDIEVAPKLKSVSMRRKRQFALIQPTTKTRIDLGLKFNNRPIAGRLEGSGPFGTMCTHRVQLTDKSQVDDELVTIIKDAYEEAG